jgi:hypothetical protein
VESHISRKTIDIRRISCTQPHSSAACAAFLNESRMKFVRPHQAPREIYGAPWLVVGKIVNAIARFRLDEPHHIHDVMSDALH